MKESIQNNALKIENGCQSMPDENWGRSVFHSESPVQFLHTLWAFPEPRFADSWIYLLDSGRRVV